MNGLSAATFRQLVQDKVEVVFDDGIVPLELLSVKEFQAGKDFEHFSLVFRGTGILSFRKALTGSGMNASAKNRCLWSRSVKSRAGIGMRLFLTE
ncbi:hypothetical protein N6H14_20930 [Paenibacillus sp. CC-CFT747]|nr:hypothetical protein N6H14_20930 [Paenibacillus sp. CC-CFT747]